MEEITPSEMLTIIDCYSNKTNNPIELGKLYAILVNHCPDVLALGTEDATRALKEPEKIKDINQKMMAVIAAKKDKTAVATSDVGKYIDSAEGMFSVGELYTAFDAKSKQDKDVIRYAVHKCLKEGRIESEGKRSGVYRRIQKAYDVLDIEHAEDTPLDWLAPLGLQRLCKLYPKSVVLVAGVANMGKSAFAMEMVRGNKHLFPGRKIRFQTTEAGDVEIKSRLLKYPQDFSPLRWWIDNVEFIDRSENWVDVIDPDGLNVVDYVSDYKEAYMVPYYIKQIHDKLKHGIAVLVVQKDPNKAHGQGGQGVKHAARVAVDIEFRKMTLSKAKVPIRQPPDYGHVDGMFRIFDLEHAWKFVGVGEWMTDADKKYAAFPADKKGTNGFKETKVDSFEDEEARAEGGYI